VALHDRRAAEMRVQVERLRDALAATQGHGRAPPVAAVSVEGRFAALELDAELERMRQSRRAQTTADEPRRASSTNEEQGG
jgi:hypothetical protein